MLVLLTGLALAQDAPCDDPPEEVVKCEAKTTVDPDRKIDFGALLGGPVSPKADGGCHRTMVTVVSGSAFGVADRLAAVDEALTGCAAEARKRDPALAGAASYTLTVDATGHVSTARRSSTLTDADVVGCFERALGAARFGPGARVVHVDVGCAADN